MWKSIQTPCGQFIFIEAEVVAELMQVGGADFVAVEFLPGPSEIPDVFQEENNLMRDGKVAWWVVEGFTTKKAKGVDGDVIINHAGRGFGLISNGKRLCLVVQVGGEIGKGGGHLGLGKEEQLLEERAISQGQSGAPVSRRWDRIRGFSRNCIGHPVS